MKNIIFIFAFIVISNVTFGSELFVKINSQNSFYAMVGLQTQNNNTNIFRFFDLQQGFVTLSVYQNSSNTTFYSGSINLDYNQRVICEIDNNGNLSVIARQTVNYINWYTESNSNSTNWNNNNNNWNNNGGNSGNWNNSNDNGYQAFVKMIEDDSFDSGRLQKAKSYISKTSLSAGQIAEICTKFSFDSGKVEWAKYAYQYCHDKQNYFLLKPSFTFSSSYSEVEKFIEGK